MSDIFIQINIPLFHLAYMKPVPLKMLLFQQVVEIWRRQITTLSATPLRRGSFVL